MNHGTHIDVSWCTYMSWRTYMCVICHMCLYRLMAINTLLHLDRAYIENESRYTNICVMIHTFVCVASNVSVSPDGYKPITILGSCMYGKRVLVHIQTCHSVHTCVCHVTRWPSVDSRSSTDCNRHITIFGSCMWGKRVTVHNTNVLRRTRV